MEILQNKFAFFANFAETIREAFPPEKQADAYKAICEYGIYGLLPEDPILKGMCLMAKVSINKVDGRSKNGGNHNPEGINQHSKEVNQVNSGQSGQFLSETETRNGNKKRKQETETETEAEAERVSADAPAETAEPLVEKQEYAFEGKVIKLRQKHFDEWQRAYPDLNLYAECLMRDDWLKDQPEAERQRWFISTAAYFAKQNERRKVQNNALKMQEEPDWGDYL